MTAKTISIDADAYERLTSAKRGDETFSDVIKRVVPKPIDYDDWLRSIAADPVGDDFVTAVEAQVAHRTGRPQERT